MRSVVPVLADAVSVTVPSFEPDSGVMVNHDEALLLTAQVMVFEIMISDISPPESGKSIELVDKDISTGTSVIVSQEANTNAEISNVITYLIKFKSIFQDSNITFISFS